MEPLGADNGEAGVGIAQHQHGVGLQLCHELVAFGDDVAHGLAQVAAHGVQVNLGIGKLQIPEENAVEIIVVVLTRVGENGVEILPALGDDGGQPDDLRAGADDDEQLQLAVVLKSHDGSPLFSGFGLL